MLGSKTDRTTDREELLRAANTSGSGEPTHEPQVATQTYVDTATGTVYEWWAGAWHAS